MTFKYHISTQIGEEKEGKIEAQSKDVAITALQRRGFIVISIREESEHGGIDGFLSRFDKIPFKDVVIMSRQIATLFSAQVSAGKAFSLLATTTDNRLLKKVLDTIISDIQAGVSISGALAKHPKVFSNFYINMVRAGEESGKLSETFIYLADYLERQHKLNSKIKSALVYPSFIIFIFLVVMVLMFTMIIPQLRTMIEGSGAPIPVFTKAVFFISKMLIQYGLFVPVILAIVGTLVYLRLKTPGGKESLDRLKINAPLFGKLFRKVYLARIADNIDTMLTSGVPIVKAIDITSTVVGNVIYEKIINETSEAIKGGAQLSDAFAQFEPIPPIMTQMVKVGEETGSLGAILKTLAKFYAEEVERSVDTMIGLIEPAMIVMLGVSVGGLLASVMLPIYNIASGIN
jgi:type IV pilus assembly protein PilC